MVLGLKAVCEIISLFYFSSSTWFVKHNFMYLSTNFHLSALYLLICVHICKINMFWIGFRLEGLEGLEWRISLSPVPSCCHRLLIAWLTLAINTGAGKDAGLDLNTVVVFESFADPHPLSLDKIHASDTNILPIETHYWKNCVNWDDRIWHCVTINPKK